MFTVLLPSLTFQRSPTSRTWTEMSTHCVRDGAAGREAAAAAEVNKRVQCSQNAAKHAARSSTSLITTPRRNITR